MKKVTICFSALCMSLQYASAQVSIMPEVGMNLSNMSGSDNSGGATESFKNKIGLKIGTSVLIPVSKSFFFQPGIFFSNKGTRDSYEESYMGNNVGYKASLNTNYLEIPLNIGYRNDLGSAGSLFFTAGPYFAYGLSGNSIYEEYMNGILLNPGKDKIDIFGKDGLKRTDIGLNFGIGYILPFGIFARAQYGTSLTSLSKKSDYSIRNKGWSFSAGYVYTFTKTQKAVKTGTNK